MEVWYGLTKCYLLKFEAERGVFRVKLCILGNLTFENVKINKDHSLYHVPVQRNEASDVPFLWAHHGSQYKEGD